MRVPLPAKVISGETFRALGARGSILLAGQLVAAALAAVVVIVLARGLGSVAYGQLALISTSVYVIAQVIDARIWEAATRFGSQFLALEEPGRARATLELGLLVNLLAGLLAAGLVALAAGPLAGSVLDDEGLAGEVVLFAAVAPLNTLQAASYAILRVMDRFRALATLIAVGAAVRLAAAGLAIALDDSLGTVLLALVCAEAIATSLLVGLAVITIRARLPRDGGWAARLRSIRGELPEMGRFVAASNATGTLRVLTSQGDVLLVGLLATPAAAGALKVARTFVKPLGLLATPYQHAIYPELVRDASRRRLDRFRERTWPASRAIAGLIVPMAVLIAATSPLTVPLLVGSGYGTAAATIVPLALAGAIDAVLFWLQPAALALDMQLTSLRAMALATLVQVGALLLLIPPLGAPGAGIAAVLLIGTWTAILLPRIAARTSRAVDDATPIASVA